MSGITKIPVMAHTNDDGVSGWCQAEQGQCPFRDSRPHYATIEEARSAYEHEMRGQELAVTQKAAPQPKSLHDLANAQEHYLSHALHHGKRLPGHAYAQRGRYIENVLQKLTDAGRTTEDQHSTMLDNGTRIYTPERQDLHDELVQDFLHKHNDVPTDGKVVFSGGLGGAGKSTVLHHFVDINPDDYATVNPDDVKEDMAKRGLIPKVKGLTPMESSPLVHEEASYIAKQMQSALQQQRKNIIVDTTMAGTQSVETKIQRLRDAGYSSENIRAVFVDIDPDTSKDRARSRHRAGVDEYTVSKGQNGIGGRYLPEHITDAQRTDNPQFRSKNAENFAQLHQDGAFHHVLVFDNDGDEPRPVQYDKFTGTS